MMAHCSACGRETNVTIRSMVNGEPLCPQCSDKERKRPIYEKGQRVVQEAAPTKHGLPSLAGPGKDGVNFYR